MGQIKTLFSLSSFSPVPSQALCSPARLNSPSSSSLKGPYSQSLCAYGKLRQLRAGRSDLPQILGLPGSQGHVPALHPL